MKYVDVGKEIQNYEGKGIPSGKFEGEGENRKPATAKVKDIMNQYVAGFMKDKDPDKMILAWRVGQKIHDADGEVALEDAEFELVKEAMQKPAHAAALYGPAYYELQLAEKRAEKAEEERKPNG